MNNDEPKYFAEFKKEFADLKTSIDTKEPRYFKKFKKEFIDLKKHLETHEPKYFRDFRKETNSRFDNIDEKFKSVDFRFVTIDNQFGEIKDQLLKIEGKLDSHFDQIGELKVEVTKSNLLLAKKSDHKQLKHIENRTEKLEKAVFA